MPRTSSIEMPFFAKGYESLTNKLLRFHNTLISARVGKRTGILVLYMALLFLFYNGLFNNWLNLDLPDLGPFPLYPTLTTRFFFYSWQIQGLGFQGSQLPYGLIVDGLVLIFGNPGIAEKVWLLSLLPIASISMYLLSRRVLSINNSSSVFLAFLFSFNPVTAGLIYEGSVNDTLTTYAFFPLLMFFAIESFNTYRNTLKSIQNVIIFSILFIYVFFWNPQIIMWIGPFYLSYLIFLLLRKGSLQDKRKILLSGISFTIIFTALSGSFTTILQFLSLQGSNAFSIAAGGTSSVTNIANDLRDNFHGQFSFLYWYLAASLLTWNVAFFRARKRDRLLNNNFILHYSIVVEVLLILSIWLTFQVNATSLILFLSRYFPIIGAYEPFPAMAILFSLLFTDSCIVVQCVGMHPRFLSFYKTDREVIRAFKRSLPKLLAVLLVILILFSSAPFWRNGRVPSTVGMIQQSSKVNELYSVPSGINDISRWFYRNVSSVEQSRVLLVPQGGFLSAEFSNYVPWVSFVSLSPSLYNRFQPMIYYNSTSNLANLLSVYGVKYVVVYKGPYPMGDGRSSFNGNVRFSPSGPPWDLAYTPLGSWQNWAMVFSHCQNFSLAANLSNADIFYNTLYKGIIYSFEIGNSGVSLNKMTFSQTENKLIYSAGPNLVTNNWSGLNSIPWRYNWTESEYLGNLQLEGGPLPKNLSYSNLWQVVKLKNDTQYNISFSLEGKYMQNSAIYVRFYNGINMTGNVVATFGRTFTGNISSPTELSFLFNTPSNFKSAAVFPTYEKNVAHNNQSYTVFGNISIFELANLPAKSVPYSFANPTFSVVHLTDRVGALLVVFASASDSGWVLRNNTDVFHSIPINNGFFIENGFLLNNSYGNYTLVFEGQTTYQKTLAYEIAGWIVLGLSLIVVIILQEAHRRRKH